MMFGKDSLVERSYQLGVNAAVVKVHYWLKSGASARQVSELHLIKHVGITAERVGSEDLRHSAVAMKRRSLMRP
mgnify:CR=1 FL=1